ncbi:MAG: FHA domain-containing protein, partial [Planctomycetaceae bacterium]
EGGRVILTDLDSTNGTRVNGHPVQMRVLQPGDQLAIGRCLLIFGSDREIAERAAQLHDNGRDDENHTVEVPQSEFSETFNQEHLDSADFTGEFDFLPGPDAELLESLKDELFPDGPPQPPLDLKPVQRAELSDFLAYAHEQIRIIVQSAAEDRPGDADPPQPMCVSWQAWQRLLSLEMHLARYLRHLAEPGE